MSALTQLVQENLDTARRGMTGRAGDERVAKAAKPLPQQVDTPQGLGNTPPTTQAHDMYEGIDLTSPVMLNSMYQRYGPAMVHAAVRKHSSKALRTAAQQEGLHPRVRVLLHAAASVHKAFTGGNPLPAGPAEYANSTPPIAIPARPNHGAPGNPENTYPATVGGRSQGAATAAANPGAVTQQPQTAGAASQSGGTDLAVCRQWVFSPAKGNPVNMPGGRPVGVGTAGDDDRDDGPDSPVPSAGDLVHFRGPGGSTNTAKLVQVTTGAAIGEFAGQSYLFPLDSVSPHNVGGSDHGPTNAPAGLTQSRAGAAGVGVGNSSGVGVGQSAAEGQPLFKAEDLGKLKPVPADVLKAYLGFSKLQAKLQANGRSAAAAGALAAKIGRKKYGKKKFQRAAKLHQKLGKPVKKATVPGKSGQRDAVYFGGQTMRAPSANAAGIVVRSPDDGAVLTPYNDRAPYNPEAGAQSGATPGNGVQSHGLTARERLLIERVLNHKLPVGTEVATLKALRAGEELSVDDRGVIKSALRRHTLAVPANKHDVDRLIAKL